MGKLRKTEGTSLVHNVVRSVAVDADNNKWFGTEFGLSEFDGTVWQTYLAENPSADFVLDLFFDNQGSLWIGSLAGVTKFDGSTFTDYDMSSGLVYSSVQAIAQDQDAICGLVPISGHHVLTVPPGKTIPPPMACLTIGLQILLWIAITRYGLQPKQKG